MLLKNYGTLATSSSFMVANRKAVKFSSTIYFVNPQFYPYT